jgi:cyanophycinase
MGNERGYIIPIGGAEEKEGGSILERFAKLCGGSSARIAVIPTASQDPESGPRNERHFREMGVRKVRVLPLESRQDCQDEKWVRKIEDADGVYMTGGNQLRLSTTLGGTGVAEAMRRCNAAGLHVAGTSAGASFLSEHMIAYGDEGSTPRASLVTLAPGLGLSDRFIIDQHFRQRNRLGRLLAAISYNPRCLGLGVDEDTAAFIAPDDTFEVVGSGAVTVIDPSEMEYSSMDSAERDRPVSVINVRIHVLTEGGTYDISARRARVAPALTGKP